MNSFQLIVLSIFVVLAILLLVSFAVMLNSKKDEDSEYPTSYSQCPDYWDASGNQCVYKSINIGNSSLPRNGPSGMYDPVNNAMTFDENNIAWKNHATNLGLPYRCALKKWANDSNVIWDGITNYNSAYC